MKMVGKPEFIFHLSNWQTKIYSLKSLKHEEIKKIKFIIMINTQKIRKINGNTHLDTISTGSLIAFID